LAVYIVYYGGGGFGNTVVFRIFYLFYLGLKKFVIKDNNKNNSNNSNNNNKNRKVVRYLQHDNNMYNIL